MLIAHSVGCLVRIDSQDFGKQSAGARVMTAGGGSWLRPKVEFLIQGEDGFILPGSE